MKEIIAWLGLGIWGLSLISPAFASTANLSPAEMRKLVFEKCIANKVVLGVTWEQYKILSDIGLHVLYNEDYTTILCNNDSSYSFDYTEQFNTSFKDCMAGNLRNNTFFIPAQNIVQLRRLIQLKPDNWLGKSQFVPATPEQSKNYQIVFGFPAKQSGMSFTCTPTK
jgi:hypothetical protein